MYFCEMDVVPWTLSDLYAAVSYMKVKFMYNLLKPVPLYHMT